MINMDYLILFDIDGTILKLKQYHSKSIFRKCLLNIYNIDVEESLMPNFSGMTDLQILNEICEIINFPIEKIQNKINLFWEALINEFEKDSIKSNIILLPEINNLIEWLNTLENVYLGIVTGNFKENAFLKLSAFNLHKYFEIGAFGCEFADRNELPPLAIKRANNNWGNKFNIDNTIIIGDSPNDIICAQKNNIFSVIVSTGFHDVEELNKYKPNLIFDDFSDYKSKFETIFSELRLKKII